MNKAVLISIQPYYVFLIIAQSMDWNIPQDKTIEVRKGFPKDSEWNRRVHIYCSKNRKSFNRIPAQYQPFMEKLLGKVIGEFVCDRIEEIACHKYNNGVGFDYSYYTNTLDTLVNETHLSDYDMQQYLGRADDGECVGYGIHITDLKIYDTPKELGEFRKPCPFNENCDLACPHAFGEYHGDGINGDVDFVGCGNILTRAPQSWCYVEEI